MAISFVASTRSPTSYPGGENNTDTCVINKPTGTTTDDIMIAFVQAGGSISFSAPAGWTSIAAYANADANMSSHLYYKVAVSGDSGTSNYTFTADSALTPMYGMILTYRDAYILDPINATESTNTGTTGTSAVAAPTVVSTAPAWYIWFRAGKIQTTPPPENDFTTSGGTERQTGSNRGAGTGYFCQSADSNGVLPTGSNGGATFTRSGSGTFNGSLARTVVLRDFGETDADAGALAVSPTVSAKVPMSGVGAVAQGIG